MKIAVDFDGTIVEHDYPAIGETELFAFPIPDCKITPPVAIEETPLLPSKPTALCTAEFERSAKVTAFEMVGFNTNDHIKSSFVRADNEKLITSIFAFN